MMVKICFSHTTRVGRQVSGCSTIRISDIASSSLHSQKFGDSVKFCAAGLFKMYFRFSQKRVISVMDEYIP